MGLSTKPKINELLTIVIPFIHSKIIFQHHFLRNTKLAMKILAVSFLHEKKHANMVFYLII